MTAGGAGREPAAEQQAAPSRQCPHAVLPLFRRTAELASEALSDTRVVLINGATSPPFELPG